MEYLAPIFYALFVAACLVGMIAGSIAVDREAIKRVRRGFSEAGKRA